MSKIRGAHQTISKVEHFFFSGPWWFLASPGNLCRISSELVTGKRLGRFASLDKVAGDSGSGTRKLGRTTDVTADEVRGRFAEIRCGRIVRRTVRRKTRIGTVTGRGVRKRNDDVLYRRSSEIHRFGRWRFVYDPRTKKKKKSRQIL